MTGAPFDLGSNALTPWMAAWQRAVAESLAAAARDPRCIALGLEALRAHTAWVRGWRGAYAQFLGAP